MTAAVSIVAVEDTRVLESFLFYVSGIRARPVSCVQIMRHMDEREGEEAYYWVYY